MEKEKRNNEEDLKKTLKGRGSKRSRGREAPNGSRSIRKSELEIILLSKGGSDHRREGGNCLSESTAGELVQVKISERAAPGSGSEEEVGNDRACEGTSLSLCTGHPCLCSSGRGWLGK